MSTQTQATVSGQAGPFELDFSSHRWLHEGNLPESDFPLVADVDGKRYELYSDGTFNEEELP